LSESGATRAVVLDQVLGLDGFDVEGEDDGALLTDLASAVLHLLLVGLVLPVFLLVVLPVGLAALLGDEEKE
jgi:hypothetical protein